MKKILFLLFIALNTLATVRPNVVLLSSLDTPKIWYHSNKWKIEKTLNKIFYKRFKKSGLNIVIKEKVDQETLRTELMNPKNIAVFWVSHAKDEQVLSGGISSDAAIVDYYGVDVKSHFKNIHPNMKYVGLVGCNAKNLIQKYRDEGNYADNKDLEVHSYDKKVDARIGLRKSIRLSAKHIGKLKKRLLATPQVIGFKTVFEEFENNKSCNIKKSGFKVEITRELKEDSPVVAVKSNDKILHVFAQGKAGDIQKAEVFFQPSSKEITKNTFKLSVDTNLYSSLTKLYLGDFSFDSSWNGNWKLFAKRDGTPLGVTKNLFRYKAQLPSNIDKEEFSPYECLKLSK